MAIMMKIFALILVHLFLSNAAIAYREETYAEVLIPQGVTTEGGEAHLYAKLGAVCEMLESISTFTRLINLSKGMGTEQSLQAQALISMGTHIHNNVCSWTNQKVNLSGDLQLANENGECHVGNMATLCLQVRAYNIASR